MMMIKLFFLSFFLVCVSCLLLGKKKMKNEKKQKKERIKREEIFSFYEKRDFFFRENTKEGPTDCNTVEI